VDPEVQLQPAAPHPGAAPGTRTPDGDRAAAPRIRKSADGPRCGAPKAGDGLPCQTRPLTGHPSGRCRAHAAATDPELALVVAAERSRGGQVAQQRLSQAGLQLGPVDFSTSVGVRSTLEATAAAVAAGKIPASVAGAVAQIASVSIRVAELELHVQLTKLEAELKRVRDERR